VTSTPPEAGPAQKARVLRRGRIKRLSRRLSIGVLAPTLLVAAYFFFIASDRYESTALATVQSAELRSTSGFESLLGSISAGAGSKDALRIRYYILSRDMLSILDQKAGFCEHFQATSADWWSRLSESANTEERYDFFKTMVNVDHDNQSGVLTLSVQAFSGKKAHLFAKTILTHSEKFVNELSRRIRLDRMKFAKVEVSKAEVQLAQARKVILGLQAEGKILNPAQSATTLLSIRSNLAAELAKTRAEIHRLRSFMQPGASKVVALRQKARSLASQIAREETRLVGPKKNGLSTTIAHFEEAMLSKEFAEKKFLSALTALEIASLEAARQHSYLAIISAQSAPDEPTHPKRILGTVKALFLFLAFFVIASLLISAVREHARL
jgi:capsular polysaccharide transport system permease protein